MKRARYDGGRIGLIDGDEIHDECELGIIIGKRARMSLKAVAAR